MNRIFNLLSPVLAVAGMTALVSSQAPAVDSPRQAPSADAVIDSFSPEEYCAWLHGEQTSIKAEPSATQKAAMAYIRQREPEYYDDEWELGTSVSVMKFNTLVVTLARIVDVDEPEQGDLDTALFMCAALGYPDIALDLMDLGADPDSEFGGTTPRKEASQVSADVAQLFLNHKKAVGRPQNKIIVSPKAR